MKILENYESPQIEVIEMEVEKGFAASNIGGETILPGVIENGSLDVDITEEWDDIF